MSKVGVTGKYTLELPQELLGSHRGSQRSGEYWSPFFRDDGPG